MRQLKTLVWLGMTGALLLVAGCQRQQQEPVHSTTSQGGTSTAPSGQSADNRGFALVRFVNAAPTMASADAYMDSVNVFSGVSYKTITPYKEVPDGRHTFRLHRETAESRESDKDRNRPENSESLSGGGYYTIVLLPPDVKAGDRDDRTQGGADRNRKDMQPKIEVVKDDFGSPSTDKAKVRVINAAAGYDDLDLYAPSKDDAIISSVGFNGKHGYKDIDPMTAALQIRESSKNKTTLATVPNRSFEAGKAYTIVVTGSKASGKKLDVVTVEDQFTSHPGRDADNDRDASRRPSSGM